VNHDQAKSAISVLFEGRLPAEGRSNLRGHLKGCETCRSVYDRTAFIYRRIHHRPAEMSPEELWLFEPPLPPRSWAMRWPV
jgi:predicted anti-sigma-YlaC factor YlaD